MAASTPSQSEWLKQLGNSTYGILAQRMSPADRREAYRRFVANYARKPDVVEASANAVTSLQIDQASAAAAARKKKTANNGTAPAASTTPGASATAAPDAASQAAQNPSASDLTQGPFTLQPQTSSLFASGLDPKTKIPGNIDTPATGSSGITNGSYSVPDTAPVHRANLPQTQITQTADQWLIGLYKMDPGKLRELQTKLYAEGWYDPNAVPNPSVIPYGKVDPATIAAYEAVMTETARYNAAGKHLTIDDVLSQGAPRVPGANPKLKAPSKALTNPADIAAGYKTEAQQLTGQNPTDEAGFQQYYQSQEKAAYAQFAQAGEDRAAGLGGAYVDAPTVPNAADAYLQQNDPTQVLAYGMASRAAAFQQLLGSATGL